MSLTCVPCGITSFRGFVETPYTPRTLEVQQLRKKIKMMTHIAILLVAVIILIILLCVFNVFGKHFVNIHAFRLKSVVDDEFPVCPCASSGIAARGSQPGFVSSPDNSVSNRMGRKTPHSNAIRLRKMNVHIFVFFFYSPPFTCKKEKQIFMT